MWKQSTWKLAFFLGVKVGIRFAHNNQLREVSADAVISTPPPRSAQARPGGKYTPLSTAPSPLNGYWPSVDSATVFSQSHPHVQPQILEGQTLALWICQWEPGTPWGIFHVLGRVRSAGVDRAHRRQGAVELEGASDKAVVEACTDVLQRIFGKSGVTAPKESTVTRWEWMSFPRLVQQCAGRRVRTGL